MKLPLQPIILCAGVYLFLSAALDLRAHLAYRELQDFQRQSVRSDSGAAGIDQTRDAVRLATAASGVTSARPEAFLALAALNRSSGEAEGDPNLRIGQWCESLSALSQALKMRPYSAQLLVNWANLRQLLGMAPCPQPLTEGRSSEVAALALESGSNNTAVVYAAALIAYWSGDRRGSLELFNRYLTYAVSPTEGQLQLIRSAIRSGADFKMVVPARFPQAATWLRLVEQYGPKPQALEPELSQVLVSALAQSRADYEQGKIAAARYFSRLTEISESSLTNSLRKQVDTEISQFAQRGGNRALAEYLSRRATFDELKVVPSVLLSDTKPGSSGLASWAKDEMVALDNSHTTVGFYLAPQQNLKVVELAEKFGKSELSPNLLRTYCSEDNQKWSEISGVKANQFKLGRNALIALSFEAPTCKYFKVHFDSSGHGSTFRNDLSRLIRVYGYSTRQS